LSWNDVKKIYNGNFHSRNNSCTVIASLASTSFSTAAFAKGGKSPACPIKGTAGTGNPHDFGQTSGNPHDSDHPTGNPHDACRGS